MGQECDYIHWTQCKETCATHFEPLRMARSCALRRSMRDLASLAWNSTKGLSLASYACTHGRWLFSRPTKQPQANLRPCTEQHSMALLSSEAQSHAPDIKTG